MANRAFGHAFNAKQLLETLNLSKVKFTSSTCKALTNNQDRRTLVINIFKTTLFLIIDDIIENSINFKCPGCRLPTYIYMKRVDGSLFKKARKNGRWADVDLLESNFSSAYLTIDIQRKVYRYNKSIYVDTTRRDRIIEKINSGFIYSNINERDITYYIPTLTSIFPGITSNDLISILSNCFKLLYLHITYGTDVVIKTITPSSFAYFGSSYNNSITFYHYYARKLYKKLLYTIKKRKIPHGEYFYFALSKKQYEEYKKVKLEHPKQKIFYFDKVVLYAYKDLRDVKEKNKHYYFKIKYEHWRNVLFLNNIRLKNIELTDIIQNAKFDNILIESHKYEIL